MAERDTLTLRLFPPGPVVRAMMFFSKRDSKPQTGKRSASQEIFTRADRYKLKTPIRYRRSGQMGWRNGTTVNLSKSGVLFLADAAIPAGTSIEVVITLPQKTENNEPKTLAASAMVAGERHAEKGEKGHRIAARILNYSL